MSSVPQVLNLAIWQENGQWIVQYMDHDIAASGSTLAEALHHFGTVYQGERRQAARFGKLDLSHIQPIPQVMRDRILAGRHPSAYQEGGGSDAKECPPDCMMCSGEACEHCGAGCWSNVTNCEHDIGDRHLPPPQDKPG